MATKARGGAARTYEMNALLGSIGGLTKAARQNAEQRAADTAAARANGPGALEYWERKVDPDGVMSPADRAKCAGAAKREHFARLALASAKARRQKTKSAEQALAADPASTWVGPDRAELIRIDAFRKRVMVPS
jgi:hypothetical protein